MCNWGSGWEIPGKEITMPRSYILRGTVVTPRRILRDGCVWIDGATITAVGAWRSYQPAGGTEVPVLDLRGRLMFPGLVNCHDHLRVNWLPRVGSGPYPSVYEWIVDQDVPGKYPGEGERKLVARPDLDWLAAYKQLLSGVTTVVNHLPPEADVHYLPEQYPVRVWHAAGRGSTVRYELDGTSRWGRDARAAVEEYAEARRRRQPYMIHAAEGTTAECYGEIAALDHAGLLGPQTVLIHAIALTPADIGRIAAVGARVVWCPFSNLFLIGAVADVPRLLAQGVPVGIGTDSTLSGAAHLFAELRTAWQVNQDRFGGVLTHRDLVWMVTGGAARVFGLHRRLGTLTVGRRADVLVLEGDPSDPYRSLVEHGAAGKIALLLRDGRPLMGNLALRAFCADAAREDQDWPWGSTELLVEGQPKFVAGDPLALLERCRAAVGYAKQLDYLPIGPAADLPSARTGA